MVRRASLAIYIGSAFVRYTTAFLVGLLGLVLVIDVVGESTRIMAVAGAGAPDLLVYAAYRAPILTDQLAPFVVLLGALATMVTLAYSSQIAAMQSSGMSVHELVAPVVAVGVVCGLLHFALNEWVTVPAATRLSQWQAERYGGTAGAPREREVWIDTGAAIVHATAAVPEGDHLRLENVTLFHHAPTGVVTAVAIAKRADITAAGGLLIDVKETDLLTNQVRTAAAEPSPPGLSPLRILDEPIAPNHLRYAALARELAETREYGASGSALATELHHRVTWPLACALMPLFAGFAAFGFARAGSVLPRAAAGFLLGFFYFVGDSFVGALGRSGALPPAVAAWAPLLFFLLLAEIILLRLSVPALMKVRLTAKID
jgi:lipopolysaccharide export system permease protein